MRDIKKLVLVFSLLIYVVLLLLYCNKQGFWHDEIYTSTFLKGSSAYDFKGGSLYDLKDVFSIENCKKILNTDNYSNNFYLQIQHEGHPPLYFFLLKGWSLIFGYSELALRSFSVVCGILFLLVLNSLIKFKSKKSYIANLFVIITLFNPFLFYYFSEARMYALAMLFAILSFNFWVKYQNSVRKVTKDYLMFVLSATALLYTHYYGVFFLTTLLFFEIIKNGLTNRILKSLLPLLLFSPWLFIIRKQLVFHSNHWTDGSYSIFDSISGFINGISELLFSPVSSLLIIEQVITLIFLIFLLVLLSKEKKGRYWILGVGIYFLQIFIFDQLLDHHTIIIPRYYIFILIFIIWGVFNVYEKIPKIVRVFSFSLYIIIGANSIHQIYQLERAPKQMYREISSYIDVNYNEENTLIVFENKGPSIFGVANYIKGNFNVVYAADYLSNNKYKNIIFIEEVLGISYLNSIVNVNRDGLKLVPFVGVNLYE